MTKPKIVTLLVAAALALVLPATVLAQQPPAHRFGGSVTLDGAAAKDGTKVGAVVDGKEVASATTTGGNYRLDVAPPEGTSFAGKTVSFTVGGFPARETATWEQGGANILNLTAITTPG